MSQQKSPLRQVGDDIRAVLDSAEVSAIGKDIEQRVGGTSGDVNFNLSSLDLAKVLIFETRLSREQLLEKISSLENEVKLQRVIILALVIVVAVMIAFLFILTFNAANVA